MVSYIPSGGNPFGALGLVPGEGYFTLGQGSSGTTSTMGNGNFRCYPWYCPTACTVNLGLEVTVVGDAGCVLVPGVYSHQYGTTRPGTLIGQVGAIPGDAVAVTWATGTVALPRGWVWLGAELYGVTTTQPMVRTPNAAADSPLPFNVGASPSAGLTVLAQVAAVNNLTLPTTASWSAGGSGVPRIMVKVVSVP